MWRRQRNDADVYLKPGELFFGEGRRLLNTVLGSCVAITMWHPERRAGGMCHIMLPGASDGRSRGGPSTCYADDAFDTMALHARRIGTYEEDYQYKLFGGGDMFPQLRGRGHRPVGESNVEHVEGLLAARGIRPLVEHTGGCGQRVLVMELWSGVVWLRHDSERARESIVR